MRRRSIAETDDRFQSDADSAVETNGVIRAGYITVDGPGDTDDIKAVFAQFLSPFPGTVAADDDKALDPCFFRIICRVSDRRFCFFRIRIDKLKAARRIQDGTASVNDIAHGNRIQIDDVVFQKAAVASQDTLDFDAVIQGITGHSTDAGIHTLRVAAGSQHTDRLHL